jgi:hypothetical protein
VATELSTAHDSKQELLAENQSLRQDIADTKAELSHCLPELAEKNSPVKIMAAAVHTKVGSMEKQLVKVNNCAQLEEELEEERGTCESRGELINLLTADLTASNREVTHLRQQLQKLQEQLDAAHQQSSDRIAQVDHPESDTQVVKEQDEPDPYSTAKNILDECVQLLEDPDAQISGVLLKTGTSIFWTNTVSHCSRPDHTKVMQQTRTWDVEQTATWDVEQTATWDVEQTATWDVKRLGHGMWNRLRHGMWNGLGHGMWNRLGHGMWNRLGHGMWNRAGHGM